MRCVFERRASTILFRLAAALPEEAGVFLLPANVCPVVPMALLAAGRGIEFLDLDPGHLCMSEALLLERLEAPGRQPVAGVVFVHTFGCEYPSEPLFHQLKAKAPGLLIVDDRCLSRPMPNRGEIALRGADVVLFSTGYSKQVDLGFGGFAYLATGTPYSEIGREYRSEDLEQFTALYKEHIRTRTPIFHAAANPEGQCRLRKLRWLDTALPALDWREYVGRLQAAQRRVEDHRARLNAIYRREIPEAVQLPPGYHAWRFQIHLSEPGVLLEKIFAAGFFASDHYFPAAVLFGGHPCPVASAVQSKAVNLFNDSHVDEATAEAIGRIIARHYDSSVESARVCAP